MTKYLDRCFLPKRLHITLSVLCTEFITICFYNNNNMRWDATDRISDQQHWQSSLCTALTINGRWHTDGVKGAGFYSINEVINSSWHTKGVKGSFYSVGEMVKWWMTKWNDCVKKKFYSTNGAKDISKYFFKQCIKDVRHWGFKHSAWWSSTNSGTPK